MGARDTALEVLIACRRSGAWADAALQARLRRDGLTGAEAALCSRLVYGVMQHRLLLAHYLQPLCDQPLRRLQPPLADILYLGAYQILFLDRVPDTAAVDTAVTLSRSCGRGRASGMVNAVLRRLAAQKETLPPLPTGHSGEALSLRYSHPRWLTDRLLALLPPEEVEALLALNDTAAPIAVQTNSLRTTPRALTEALMKEGVTARPHPWVPACLELEGVGDMTRLSSFQAGDFFVQDAAAALVCQAAGIAPGERVLDVCAAPGGKSFSAAIAMEDRGEVLACDLHGKKLERICAGAKRLGITCIRTRAGDARHLPQAWRGRFDVVLADVPCSGLGVIRKKPDIRYKPPEALAGLPQLQGQILAAAAACARPGGVVVYSTCTLLPEENQAVIRGFLGRHPDFSMEPFSLPRPVGETTGEVTLWPQRHRTDGFYICRLRRREDGQT